MTAPQLGPNSNVAGKYTIVSLLGLGGSSATYHAVAADGREVALKIFDPAIRQRADIMSAIEQTYAATNALSPEIAVPLLDAGYDQATGAPFSVTERIPFPSLAQITAQRPLTPEELVTVLGYVGRALDGAHARQLCHHALKPTNIFVGFAQGYGLRITDFGAGLARAAVPTQEGYSLAAPWLAPEQVQGTVPAGPAADVFAAALVAFYALTGRSYWRSCQGAPDLGAWQQELVGPRQLPSARARELGAPSFPSGFDVVLGAALSLDPNQRYRSIGELAAALEAQSSAKAPESAATMAFPANMLGVGPEMGGASGGEYPPPPQPLGGMGAPGQQQGYPPQGGFQQGGGYPAGQPGGQQPPGPAADAQPPPAQAEIQRKPTMEISASRRPASNKAAPILVALVVLVLLGGSAIAFVMLGKKGGTATANSAAASASAAPSATAPATVASAEPTAPPTPTPPETASAEPATSAAAPTEPELTVSCDPECEEVKIDGKVVDISKPIPLAAGKHTVTGSKSGYTSATETVTMTAGKPAEAHLKLAAKPSGGGATTSPGPGPGTSTGSGGGSKPKCGKFIKTNCVK